VCIHVAVRLQFNKTTDETVILSICLLLRATRAREASNCCCSIVALLSLSCGGSTERRRNRSLERACMHIHFSTVACTWRSIHLTILATLRQVPNLRCKRSAFCVAVLIGLSDIQKPVTLCPVRAATHVCNCCKLTSNCLRKVVTLTSLADF